MILPCLLTWNDPFSSQICRSIDFQLFVSREIYTLRRCRLAHRQCYSCSAQQSFAAFLFLENELQARLLLEHLLFSFCFAFPSAASLVHRQRCSTMFWNSVLAKLERRGRCCLHNWESWNDFHFHMCVHLHTQYISKDNVSDFLTSLSW